MLNEYSETLRNLTVYLMKVGKVLIQIHSVSGEAFYLNCNLIFRLDGQFDTVITLIDQKKLIVREKPEEIVEKIIEYNQKIHSKWRSEQ